MQVPLEGLVKEMQPAPGHENHGIVWVRKSPEPIKSSIPPKLPRPSLTMSPSATITQLLNRSRNGDSPRFPGQLCQGSTALSRKEFS